MPRVPQLRILEGSPRGPSLAAPNVERWSLGSGGEEVAYGWREPPHWMIHVPRRVSYVYEGGANEAEATIEAGVSRAGVTDAFFGSMLPLFLQADGAEALHASAIETSRGVVALSASSGTGKSTIAAALARRGHRAWADDAVVWTLTEAGAETLPLPFRLRAADVASDANVRTAAPAPLAAIVFLERSTSASDPPASVARIGATAAFPRLLRDAYCFTLRDQPRTRTFTMRYLTLASQVSMFALRFVPERHNLDAVCDRIESVIAGLESR
jgi:hypothetical protein